MAPSNPTFVLCTGAWHLRESMSILASTLQAAGYPTRTSQLASVGNPSAGVLDDAKVMRTVLEDVLATGSDVVLVVHSYAGLPTNEAARGLSKSERGGQAGILGMIYLTAFVVPESLNIKTMIGGKWGPWQDVKESEGLIDVIEPNPVFYHDVPSPLRDSLAGQLRQQSLKAFMDPAPAPAWKEPAYDGRRAYIRCEDDGAIPLFAQDAMVDGSGVEWTIRSLKTSHSPFLSAPKELTEVLTELAAGFAEK